MDAMELKIERIELRKRKDIIWVLIPEISFRLFMQCKPKNLGHTLDSILVNWTVQVLE